MAMLRLLLALMALHSPARAADDALAWTTRFFEVAGDDPAGEALTLDRILPLTKLQRMSRTEGCQKMLGLAPEHPDFLWATVVLLDGQGDECGRYKVARAEYDLQVRPAETAQLIAGAEQALGPAKRTQEKANEVFVWQLSARRAVALEVLPPEDDAQAIGLTIFQHTRQ